MSHRTAATHSEAPIRPAGSFALDRTKHLAACPPARKDGVALVLGVGPGVGSALVRRFAAEGMKVALAARRLEKLRPLVEEFAAAGQAAAAYPCEAADERSVGRLLDRVRLDFGDPSLAVYNCEAFGPGGILETNPHAFEDCWRVNCFGAFLFARQVLPAMVSRGAGTIIFTGPTGSRRGRAGYVNLAVGKAGARMLAQSMAREFGPKGIHVAHVVLDGPILTPMNVDVVEERGVEGLLDPDAVAETIFQLHCQPKTTWTHELDLRSFVEPF